MRKLSKPISDLKNEYEVVIIGSGYGASIAASRFSRTGHKVCVLEKGKEFQPGDYPDTLSEAQGEIQINADGRDAKHNGLYELHVSENISVFKGCGLGGTSLVNANVSIKPDPRVFEDTCWPAAIRNNMKSLEEGYERARTVLKPSPYPEGKNGYPVLAKTKAMKKSAEKMNEPFRLLDINVNFEAGVNHVGVEQGTCNNCGDCVTGCNHGAKNTLIMNYLPDAVNHGAEIFCDIDVSYVEKKGNQWLVWFKVHNTGRDKFNAPLLFVRASKVILGAGSLGSTEILLRSKEKGLSVSDRLGERFTGNGDVLGFAYNCEEKINGIGLGDHVGDKSFEAVGPCITSIIDMRGKPKLEDGITFEEGSIPAPLASAINVSLLGLSKTGGEDTDSGLGDWMKEKKNEAESLIRGPYHGATNQTQTYLIMSHDDGKGKMNLKNNRLNIDWAGVGEQPIIKKANETMKSATAALGGTYIPNVTWTKQLNYGLVTVHPLGGCCMADDAGKGVTDDTGNVYSGKSGTGTHEGLYVLDGSIIPRPLGTNPLFTISALAERACAVILKKQNKNLGYDFPKVSPQKVSLKSGVQFTETMKGYFSTNEKTDFQKGFDAGKENSSAFMFTLTIQSQDVEEFVKDPTHQCKMAGTVTAPALSSKPLTISNGIFNLFVKDETEAGLKKMKYRMNLHSYEGKQYYFYGYKRIKDDKGFDMWSDTTTLYITVFEGKDENAPVLGKGILKIASADFAVQMTTMTALNTTRKLDALKAIQSFGTLFSKEVLDTYFKKLF